jgi:hypothetical protein
MTSPRCVALLLLAGIVHPSLFSSAVAQPQCGPRDQIVKALGESFKEAPVGMGVTEPGQLIELFASSSGSWTMVATAPNGTSCLIAAGENWDMVRRVKGHGI